MKFIHKTRLGLEHYFTDISPVISLLGETSPEDTMGQLMDRPIREQNEVCKRLFNALRQLLQSDFAHKELIPDNVKRIAESLIAPDAYSIERILPVLLWIEKLRLKNEQDKVQWISNLHGAAAMADPMTAAFLENFPLVDSQRVSVIREDDSIRISLPEKQWGRVSLTLPSAHLDSAIEFPLFGYLFVLEAEPEENRCGIRLLLDLEFSETPYQQRLLSDKNWFELHLTCDVPELSLALYDYTARAKSFGRGHIHVLSVCCEALQSKFALLGRGVLNDNESQLLILAQLFCSAEYLSQKPKGTPFEWNISILENRFGLESTLHLLEKQGRMGHRFASLLRIAADAFELGDNNQTMRALTVFSRTYQDLSKSITGCRFAMGLVSRFAQYTQGYSTIYSESAAHTAVLNTLSDHLGETLQGLGFSGALPHYARKYGRSVHYLSFVLGKEPYITERGHMEFPYSLSVARVSDKTVEDQGDDISYEIGNYYAEDFQHLGNLTKFGQVATEEDSGRAVFSVDFQNPDRAIDNAKPLAQQLEYHLLVADKALKDQPLDKAYRTTLRQILKRRKTLRRMAVPILLSSLASAAAVGYWMIDNVFDPHRTKLSVSGFAIAAIVVAVAVILINYWKRIRSIWTV